MAGRLVGIVAQRVAAMLRRIARALDVLQGERAPDGAIEALRARFPGAPDHWLRYIALRAPALAASQSVDAEARAPLGLGRRHAAPSPQLGQDADSRKTAPLKLERKVGRTGQGAPVAESFPAPVKTPGSETPRWTEQLRPKLRVVRFSAGDAILENSRVGVKQKATRVGSTGGGDRDFPAQNPLPSPERGRLAETVAWTLARSDPDAPAGPSDVFSWFAFPRPARLKEPSRPAEPRIARAPESFARREWSEPPQPVTHALLLGPTVRAQRANGYERLFGAEAPRGAAGPAWSIEDARSRWPELPPPADDAEPMPVTLPNLARLRAEQDQGAWSG